MAFPFPLSEHTSYSNDKFQRGRVYSLQSSLLPHQLGADVGMTTGTVPVALHRFGVQWRDDAEVFAHAVQQEAWHPQLVAHLNALAGSHLVLPLRPRRSRRQRIKITCCTKHNLEGDDLCRGSWERSPETASLRRWCRKLWFPRRGRPCSGIPRCPARKRGRPPPSSRRVLEVGDMTACWLRHNKYRPVGRIIVFKTYFVSKVIFIVNFPFVETCRRSKVCSCLVQHKVIIIILLLQSLYVGQERNILCCCC